MFARHVIAALALTAIAGGAWAVTSGGPRHDVEAISKQEVLQVIRAAKARLSECYREAVGRNAARSGKVTVKFTIASSGEVTHAEIAGSSFDDTTFHACLLDVVRRLRFSPFQGERLVITYPLVFTPEEERRRPLPPGVPSHPEEPPEEPEEPTEEPERPGEGPAEEPAEEPAEAPDHPLEEPERPPAEPEQPEQPEQPEAPPAEPDDDVSPSGPQ
ncbi:MAG: TonB family protein [Myxococcota bacterium]